MYDDYQKCSVCGSEVRLEPHPGSDGAAADVPAGPREGYVGAGDDPVDVRRCTNDACPTRKAGGPDA